MAVSRIERANKVDSLGMLFGTGGPAMTEGGGGGGGLGGCSSGRRCSF